LSICGEFRRVAAVLESGLPLVREPFSAAAEVLGVPERVLTDAVAAMTGSGLIRRFGAFFDLRLLGYRGYLFGADAGRYPGELVSILSKAGNVTHIYGRRHVLSLWFTALAGSGKEARDICRVLRSRGHSFVALETSRMIKLRPSFAGEGSAPVPQGAPRIPVPDETRCSDVDLETVRALQCLEMSRRPFALAARKAGMTEDELIRRAGSLMERGVLRRIGASLDHGRAGWTANSLCACAVRGSDDDISRAAREVVSQLPWASHCYLRRIFDCEFDADWIYNLYIMIHARSWDDIEERGRFLKGAVKCEDFVSMRTTEEYKKSSYKI
jgi:DNA-binding Lrp family transcriptional regulator